MRIFLSLALLFLAPCAFARNQEVISYPAPHTLPESADPRPFDPPGVQQSTQTDQSGTAGTAGIPKPAASAPENQETPAANAQPKRILGVMPNFRAVSAGTNPPPPTPKQAFVIATQNSFDYSSFIFVGITSAIAEGTNAHSQLGKGMAGFGRYYWRGFADKTDGNYLVIFALPTVFHQDERYFALGKGSLWHRIGYSLSRVVVARNYDGDNTFNTSELLGRGIAQGVSISYYPSKTRTWGAISTKYAYAILRDAVTNTFREVWPDIAVHVLHRHP